jgi:ABC-type glycerol-3-phosphate transport system substrate-binding protein
MGANILAPENMAWDAFIPEGEIGTDSEYWRLGTTSEKSKEAVKVLAEMYAANGLHQGIGMMSDDDDGYSQFAAGRIGAFGYGYGYYTQFHKLYMGIWKEAHADAKLSDVTLGTALNQNGNWGKTYDTGTWVGAHYFVPASCKYPDRVLDLVEYLASEEGQNMLFRGIEGLTYTMNGDQVVYNMDAFVNINKSYGYADPDRCRYMWFSYLFCGCEMKVDLANEDWWAAVTKPYDNSVDWATPADKEVYDYALSTLAGFTDNVYTQLPAYYNFVSLPADMATIRTNLKEITNRYLSAMIGGQMDIETEWANYQAEYENAGAAKIEEALNKSVAEARATYGSAE